MSECAFRAVQELIERMKQEVVERQNVTYPEQIVVADIYTVTARTLAEACRATFGKKEGCDYTDEKKSKVEVSMDTFILLKQLKEDNLISEEYYNGLFEGLIKLNPEIEKQAREDRSKGII